MIQDTRTYDISPKSEKVNFKGKVTWAQVINPNKFGNWSINLYPDADSLERLRELMLKNEWKKDDNGYYLQMSRQTNIEFQKGVQTPVTPVKMRLADGTAFNDRIGDGSDVTVTCELRKYKIPNSERYGNSIRLYGITIDNLVPAAASVPAAAEEEQEAAW